jgi:SAM-dependent methyltransferase
MTNTAALPMREPARRPFDAADFQRRLLADADLLPERFRAYFEKYVRRDADRCVTTLALLPPAGEQTRVLEVGAFPGVMSLLLKEQGYVLECVDLDPSRMSGLIARHEIPVLEIDIEKGRLPQGEGSFDHVIFAEVLEHLRINPIGALREAYRVLKPGGTLVLSVPNIKRSQRLEFLLGKDYQGDIAAEFAKLEQVGHMGHMRIYSRADVLGVLELAGFEIQSCKRAGRREIPRAIYRPIFSALSLAARLFPKVEVDLSADADLSHLYVVATK